MGEEKTHAEIARITLLARFASRKGAVLQPGQNA
jgi:hypothetical protein